MKRVARCQRQTLAVTRGQQLRFSPLASGPDRSHRMDHVSRLQSISRRNFGVAGGTATEFATRLQQLRSGGPVNGAIDSTTAQERGVGRIDDRIDRQGSNI